MFALHPKLAADSVAVTQLALCEVRLMNNSNFPWLLLIPARESLKEITDLASADQHVLIDEIAHVSRVLQTITSAEKMNIAALGNQVPQLHIHVISRFSSDSAWPNPIWGIAGKPYDPSRLEEFAAQLCTALVRK